MENQSIVPVEILCKIFCLLGPQDVVCMRAVSKQFRNISYTAEIWRTLYAHARLPRPPGPFPSQSVQFLERTLVKSERLAQSWTAQPMRYGTSVQIRLGQVSTFTPEIIYGKWYITCESSRRFVAHDLDSERMPRSQQILWEHDVEISKWDACSAMSAEGLALYILFSVNTDENALLPWNLKLLEFRMTSDSDHLNHSLSLDIPMRESNPYLYLRGGHAPFLYIGVQRLVFDVTTRRFYEFPLVGQALDNLPFDAVFPLHTHFPLFTKTHIIVLHSINANTVRPRSTLVQAFTLPTDACFDRSGTSLLSQSHEGLIHGYHDAIDLVRDSIVDPTNGETTIRLLDHSLIDKSLHLSCIDLTLPKHTPTDMTTVLPMTINMHGVLKADNVVCHQDDWTHCIEHADDGYVRGLWQISDEDETLVEASILRFTIDASQERCTGVLGALLPSEWHKIDDGPCQFSFCTVDCVRGRLCYQKMNEDLAIVVDLE